MSNSNFIAALRVLVPLGKPLFLKMNKTQRAYPMMVGICDVLLAEAAEKDRPKIKRALARMSWSGRYQRSLCAIGNVRYDLDLNIVGPVSERERQFALECRAKRRASLARQAEALATDG